MALLTHKHTQTQTEMRAHTHTHTHTHAHRSEPNRQSVPRSTTYSRKLMVRFDKKRRHQRILQRCNLAVSNEGDLKRNAQNAIPTE